MAKVFLSLCINFLLPKIILSVENWVITIATYVHKLNTASLEAINILQVVSVSGNIEWKIVELHGNYLCAKVK